MTELDGERQCEKARVYQSMHPDRGEPNDKSAQISSVIIAI